MKISPILLLLFVGVTVAVAFVLKNDKNMIQLAGKAIEEMYSKHPDEFKNFGPFLEEYYKGLPKADQEVDQLDEDFVNPAQFETVFADFDQNYNRL